MLEAVGKAAGWGLGPLRLAWPLLLAATLLGAREPAPTQLQLAADASDVLWGQPVEVVATLAAREPEGTRRPPLTLLDGGRVVAIRPAGSGPAVFTLPRLAEGLHVLTALYPGTATQAPAASAPLSLRVRPAQPPPRLDLWMLPDGAVQAAPVITLRGRAASPLGQPSVWVNGAKVPVDPDGTFAWALLGREGANPITVVARDRAGQETRATRTVTVRARAPRLFLEDLGDGAGTPDADLTLAGDVHAPGTPSDSLLLTCTLNQGVPFAVPLEDKRFTLRLRLAPGANSLDFRIGDGDEAGWAHRTVFLRPGPLLAFPTPREDRVTSLEALDLVAATAAPAPGLAVTLRAPGLHQALEAAPDRTQVNGTMSFEGVGLYTATLEAPGPDGVPLRAHRQIIRAAAPVSTAYGMADVKRILDCITGLAEATPDEVFDYDLAPLGEGPLWGDHQLGVDDAAMALTFALGLW